MKKSYWIIAIVALAIFVIWRWMKLQPVKKANEEIEKVDVVVDELNADELPEKLRNVSVQGAGNIRIVRNS